MNIASELYSTVCTLYNFALTLLDVTSNDFFSYQDLHLMPHYAISGINI